MEFDKLKIRSALVRLTESYSEEDARFIIEAFRDLPHVSKRYCGEDSVEVRFVSGYEVFRLDPPPGSSSAAIVFERPWDTSDAPPPAHVLEYDLQTLVPGGMYVIAWEKVGDYGGNTLTLQSLGERTFIRRTTRAIFDAYLRIRNFASSLKEKIESFLRGKTSSISAEGGIWRGRLPEKSSSANEYLFLYDFVFAYENGVVLVSQFGKTKKATSR